jgi:type I restriction enzyme, S subunit
VYRQSLLKWAFEGKLTNKNVKEGELPKGWKWAVTWQVFNEYESKTVIDKDKINEKYFVKIGDFLFSRANTLDLIGAAVIVHSVDRKLMLSDKTLRFLFRNEILEPYVLYYLEESKR